MPRPRPAAPVAARKLPRQRRSRDTVEVILEAAARAFDRFGYRGATTRRIAELAGVSVGSLYQYFASRDALLSALRARHLAESLAAVEACLRPSGRTDLPSMMRDIVAAIVAVHERRTSLHRLIFDGLPPAAKESLLRALEQRLSAMLEAHLVKHPELPRLDVPRSVFVLTRALSGLLHSAGEGADARSVTEVQEDMVRLAVGYLSGSPPNANTARSTGLA